MAHVAAHSMTFRTNLVASGNAKLHTVELPLDLVLRNVSCNRPNANGREPAMKANVTKTIVNCMSAVNVQ
jgi:hypothetical protein